MAEGNTLDVHLEFQTAEQKEAFKTALQGFVKQQQEQAKGLAAGEGGGGESIGRAPSGQPAGLSFYVNFIPRW
jgi:hypothetical protein